MNFKFRRLGCARSLLVAIGMLFIGAVCAATAIAQSDQDRFNKWYGDYNSNRFVIDVPLTVDNAQKLKQRLLRYRYSIIYTSAPLLDSGQQAVIRIGFFSSRKQAQQLTDAIEFLIPNQQVTTVTEAEHASVATALWGGVMRAST